MDVKGVLLCGGLGTRLNPLTLATNKHLLRVGKLPMVEYPLLKLIEAGIKDIHVVTGGEFFQGVVKYLGSGRRWGVRITYSIQDEAGGIAQALGLAESFVRNEKMVVVLGDNIFDMDLREDVKKFFHSDSYSRLFAHLSLTPEKFGSLEFSGDGWDKVFVSGDRFKLLNVEDVIEKPTKEMVNDNKMRNWVLAGLYMYTPDVFDIIKTLKPSHRGELEISDVNRFYIKSKLADIVNLTGRWTDCGSFDTLLDAETLVKQGE